MRTTATSRRPVPAEPPVTGAEADATASADAPRHARRLKTKTQVTLTLNTGMLERLQVESRLEQRSLSNMMEVLLGRALDGGAAAAPITSPH